MAGQRRPVPTPEAKKRGHLAGKDIDAPQGGVTVAELLKAFLDHAETYYRGPDGDATRNCATTN
jgi:hypothetical protein